MWMIICLLDLEACKHGNCKMCVKRLNVLIFWGISHSQNLLEINAWTSASALALWFSLNICLDCIVSVSKFGWTYLLLYTLCGINRRSPASGGPSVCVRACVRVCMSQYACVPVCVLWCYNYVLLVSVFSIYRINRRSHPSVLVSAHPPSVKQWIQIIKRKRERFLLWELKQTLLPHNGDGGF